MPIILDKENLKKLGKRKPKRVKPLKSPVKPEREVKQRIQAMYKYSLEPSIQKVKDALNSNMSLEELGLLLDQLLRKAEQDYNMRGGSILDVWRMSMGEETRYKLHAALSKSLGVDLTAVLDTPEIKDALALGSMEFERLVKTMPTKVLGEVADAVSKNMRGIPLPENRSLLKQIDFIGTKSKKWAKVIARDQTAKMTSLLNQTRQTMLGVSVYIWRTSKDERVVGNPGGIYPTGNKVHGNHYIMEGKYCQWDDATVYSVDKGKTWKQRTGEMPKEHPGMQIQCRCYAEPVIDVQQILEYAQAA